MATTEAEPTPDELVRQVDAWVWRLAWNRAARRFDVPRRPQEAERYHAAGLAAVARAVALHDPARGAWVTYAGHAALNGMRQSDLDERSGDFGRGAVPLESADGDGLAFDVAEDGRRPACDPPRLWSRRTWGRVLSALRGGELDVVRLRYFKGLNFGEIGARLGFSASRAQQLHARAIARLRKSQFLRREAAT